MSTETPLFVMSQGRIRGRSVHTCSQSRGDGERLQGAKSRQFWPPAAPEHGVLLQMAIRTAAEVVQTSGPCVHKSLHGPERGTHTAEQPPHTLLAARPPPHFSAHPSHLPTARLSSSLPIHPFSIHIHPLLTHIHLSSSLHIHPSLPYTDAPTSLRVHPSPSLHIRPSAVVRIHPSWLHIPLLHLAAHTWPDTHNSWSIRTWLSPLLASLHTVRFKRGPAEAAGS